MSIKPTKESSQIVITQKISHVVLALFILSVYLLEEMIVSISSLAYIQ